LGTKEPRINRSVGFFPSYFKKIKTTKMKKIILAFVVLFIGTTAFVTQQNRNTLILGKWKVDDGNINNFITAQIENTRKTSPERAEQMEQNLDMMQQMVASLIFEYKADGVVELTSPQGTQEVKWKLNEQQTKLIITRPNGTERVDSILELSATKFKVLQGERRDTIVYIR